MPREDKNTANNLLADTLIAVATAADLTPTTADRLSAIAANGPAVMDKVLQSIPAEDGSVIESSIRLCGVIACMAGLRSPRTADSAGSAYASFRYLSSCLLDIEKIRPSGLRSLGIGQPNVPRSINNRISELGILGVCWKALSAGYTSYAYPVPATMAERQGELNDRGRSTAITMSMIYPDESEPPQGVRVAAGHTLKARRSFATTTAVVSVAFLQTKDRQALDEPRQLLEYLANDSAGELANLHEQLEGILNAAQKRSKRARESDESA